MKLLGRTKRKINKDKSGENMPHLEITEVVLVDYSINNKVYQQNSRVFIHLLLINHFVNY